MRKDYTKGNMCPYCGDFFNYLGIASHRARCREKIFLKIGRTYRRKDRKPFPFNEETGVYIGLTSGQSMPRFRLSERRECFINAEPTAENFVEVIV